jgi:hypothetical protein
MCGNERADILANEGSISGTLFQDQAGLTSVNMSDIHTCARTRLLTESQERWNYSEMGRYCYSIVPRVSIEAWMASTVDERVFLVAMSRHSVPFAKDKCCSGLPPFASVPWGMIQSSMGYRNVSYIAH